MIGSHMARRPAMSPMAGGVKPDSAIGARAAAISGSKVKDMIDGSWLLVVVVVVDHDDDLAGEVTGGDLGVHRAQLGQRDALGDVDAQLAAVDQRRQP